MSIFEHRTRLAAEPAEVFDYFRRPANLASLTPRWLRLEIVDGPERVGGAGDRLALRLRPLGLFTVRWTSRIARFVPLREFVDEQQDGPWRAWTHSHGFRAIAGGVELRDRVRFEIGPPGLLGAPLRALARLQMRALFAYRERRLCEVFAGL